MSDLPMSQLVVLEKAILEERPGVIATQDFAEPEDIYAQLIARVRKYHPNTDISMIEKAYKIAYEAHKDQRRKSGEMYIIHPLSVALILADLELDKETIVAGILHDVVEDTVLSTEQLKEEFSEEIALIVDGVTKLTQLDLTADKVETQAENLRKMFLAMAKDIRVILVKLADRLHNMRTLQFMKPEKQKEKSKETQEIYAPLASRLGISKIKMELDDYALKYLDPDAYYDLVEKVSQRKGHQEKYIQTLVEEVSKHVSDAGIEAEVYGRAKHFFSIYKKMVNQNKTIDQIYDIFAVRIIVDSIKDCYAALGVIHEMYVPIPGRFKDYIAMPKPNRYQSLHTTVIGPSGTPFEIQIRTYEMHRISEYGIAAHWKYKEDGEGATVNNEEAKLTWLRQILEWQQDISENKEFVSLIKSDLNLFTDMVFCFTPTGDVKNLPKGSTPIDFAYSIHSAVGNRMVGAKVNGRLVQIDYAIQNGDRIEIITSQNSRGPSRDWLNIVKSSQARSKINQWFRSVAKDENVLKGKELLVSSAKAKNLDINLINKPEYQDAIMRKYGFKVWEDCLAAVGQGAIKEGAVVNRLQSEYDKEHPKIVTDADILQASAEHQAGNNSFKKIKSKNGIVVNGLYDVSVRFSKCCNPVPGDEIVGFITRGRGVSIHRTDCVNIIDMPDIERDRLIDAEWQGVEDTKEGGLYLTEINIYANNRTGLIVDISRLFAEREIDIDSINSKTSKAGVATISVKFGIKSKDELRSLVEKIRQIDNVVDVSRTSS